MSRFLKTPIPGCYQVELKSLTDERGSLTKIFQASEFAQHGAALEFKESFISHSQKGVLRGLHFQLPPNDQAKGVLCLSGTVFDVILDLRKQSPMYKKWISFDLDQHKPTLILIPRGCAHGFYVTGSSADILYMTETEHHPESDSGLLWSSAEILWPFNIAPLLSDRDAQFAHLQEFSSPF
ncbi:MAG: dTDP-4-dehydrorhamnose 3,5-epimerase family protein [Bdellovibrionales bacterium]|nr:dTDP-4-dehydrorhamnose 3,5-epimerase family protein [Bdellovibrionales bacterium]